MSSFRDEVLPSTKMFAAVEEDLSAFRSRGIAPSAGVGADENWLGAALYR